MKVVMIGAGYVGLVSGACFSEFGVEVACVDKDASRIRELLEGRIPIYEPGLEDLVRDNSKAGRLTFSADLNAAMAGAEAVFIAVGTPSRRGDAVRRYHDDRRSGGDGGRRHAAGHGTAPHPPSTARRTECPAPPPMTVSGDG